MASSELKDKVYGELSRITQAISNPKRMELLDLLSQKSWSVEELAREINMSVASTSQHLQVLKVARLVQARRQGNFIFYQVADDHVLRLVSAVKDLGFTRYAEIDRVLQDYNEESHSLESITLEELMKRSGKEKIMLIDVRPPDEYASGHIRNAISIPLPELKKRFKDLPKDKTIVAYCRGPLCVMAQEAVKFLNSKKFKAIRMEDGYVDWKLKQVS
ncbi:MAG TPA: ArsR family transcriptional regulator [Bacteroidetes bacterium]|nr:ArsR family transcriptional regulator [Bacteroidota bacterium]